MRCYCRAINDGCMATYQLPAGLVLSLKPSRRFIRQKRPATSAGFLLGDHIAISHRILPIAATEESLESSVTSRCPSRSLLVPPVFGAAVKEVPRAESFAKISSSLIGWVS